MINILSGLKKVDEYIAKTRQLSQQLQVIQAQIAAQRAILKQALEVIDSVDKTITEVTKVIGTQP